MPCVSAEASSPRPTMATLSFFPSSLSRPLLPRSPSLRLRFHAASHPHLSPSALTFLLPNPRRRGLPPIRHIARARNKGPRGGPEASPPQPSERKSLAVATGELFLGLASLLIRNRGRDAVTETYVEDRLGKSSGVVVENSDVIWEQRAQDVEAKKERKRFSSLGFSFSAAGLLFPYHLGVAQFLLEKGYIKVILSSLWLLNF